MENRLELHGADNVRDLGGHETIDRQMTKMQRFIRSDQLCALPVSDLAYLQNYGVRTVVDLRSVQEAAQLPSSLREFEGVAYYNVPLLDNIYSNNLAGIFPESMGKMYIGLLTDSKNSMREIFRIFAEHSDGCALFNCTAGKDRTGTVAMLLLKLADVKEDDIIADYALSNQFNDKILAIQRQAYEEHGVMLPDYLFEAHPKDMAETLEFLRKQYTDAETYLMQTGVPVDEIDQIKKRLLQ
jgi:protein-tyrosine phosphatase